VIGPAAVLAVIVGLFHVSAYVFIRGRAGARLPLLVLAAVLGAWAGDAVGGRMAIDPIRIGEFHLVSASLVAWLSIGLVAILSVLAPEAKPRTPEPISTTLRRTSEPAPSESTGLAERAGGLEPAAGLDAAEPDAGATRG
jgi:hypothetical protein